MFNSFLDRSDYIDSHYDSDDKIIHGPNTIFVPDPKGLGNAFFEGMKNNYYNVAQIDASTGYEESFGSLLLRCVSTARQLKNKLSTGDIISICSENNTDNYVPFIAAQMAGIIVASLDPTIPLKDTEYLLKQVNPKIIFVSPVAVKLIESALQSTEIKAEIVVFGETEKHTPFSEYSDVIEEDSLENFKPYEVEDLHQTACVMFSSGTTGLSKGICIHHYGLIHQAYIFATTGCISDIMLNPASTYWISTVNLICAMILFGKCRCIAKFDPLTIWSLIEKYRITFMFMAPTLAIQLLKVEKPDVDTSCLRGIDIGGGALSEEYILALKELLPLTYIHIVYGQTEAAGMITCFRPSNPNDVELWKERPTSCGRPNAGFLYKIVDPETGLSLGPNETGEIRYLSKSQMSGYYNMTSKGAFDKDGWVKTGDLGYFDDNLCFFIVDRIKDMLKFQSFHVAPAKIEAVLLTHPEVISGVVIGIPHDVDGDHPMGVVIVKPNSTVTEEEIITFVDKKVDDRCKLRGGVRFIKSIPLTPSGKVKRNLLKNMIIFGKI